MTAFRLREAFAKTKTTRHGRVVSVGRGMEVMGRKEGEWDGIKGGDGWGREIEGIF